MAQNCHKYYFIHASFVHFSGKTRIANYSNINFLVHTYPSQWNNFTLPLEFEASFSFKSHKNRIYLPFHQLTAHHDVQIQVNQRICIDRGR